MLFAYFIFKCALKSMKLFFLPSFFLPLTAKLQIVASDEFGYVCILVVPSAYQQSFPHFDWTTLDIGQKTSLSVLFGVFSHICICQKVEAIWKQQIITCKISSKNKSVHTDVACLAKWRSFTHILRNFLVFNKTSHWLSKWDHGK